MSSYVYVSILLLICMVAIGFYIRDNTTKTKKEFKSHIDNKQAESNKLNQAHFYSSFNRKDLERDDICGCFYCLKIFNPKEIEEWEGKREDTALCPYCGIDSIIGQSSKFPITKGFLEKMNQKWFG